MCEPRHGKALYKKLLGEQAKWIEEHGGSLGGYVARYGSRDALDHFGDGGEAIYAADIAEFQRLMALAYGHR